MNELVPANGGLILNYGDDNSREILGDSLIKCAVDGFKILPHQSEETFQIVAGTSAKFI